MPWNNMPPHVKNAGAPLRVGIVKIAGGSPKMSVGLGKNKYAELGQPKNCTVFIGDGAEQGSLLIQFDKDGEHQLSKLPRGGARLVLPLPDGAPDAKRKPSAVQFEQDVSEDDVPFLTIRLPW